MSKSTYSLKLLASVKEYGSGVGRGRWCVLEFIAAAVAEKIGSLRTARDYLRERAGSAKLKDMLKCAPRAEGRPGPRRCALIRTVSSIVWSAASCRMAVT
jgi:hypothetical protein